RGIDIGSAGSWALSITDTIIKNNLYYSPNDATPDFLNEAAGKSSGTVGAAGTFGNSSDAQGNVDPSFDSTSEAKGFRIGTGSYAASGGSFTFPASIDDFFHCDDVSANEHIGAFVPRVRT